MYTNNNTFNSFLDFLNTQYLKLIDIPDRGSRYEEKVDFATYISEYLLEGQEMYLNCDKVVAKQDVILFDNKISEMANKMYVLIEELLEKYLKQGAKQKGIDDISVKKIADLIDTRNNDLYLAARWSTLRVMNVFDINRERNKQKVPRRLPIIQEPCFCYDRVLETALGIKHEDGFNPNRGVTCLAPSSGKTYVANSYTNLMLMHFWIRYGETGLIRMTNNAANAQTYGNQCVSMLEDEVWRHVFPETKKYINSKGQMDMFKANSAEKKLLKDCNSECNDSIFMFGADAGINGKRAMLGSIMDDLSNGVDDMDNDELHMRLTDKVMSDVMDRSDDDNAPVLIQGTMFNQYDTQNAFIDSFERKGLKNYKGRNHIKVTSDGKCFTCLVDIEDIKGHSIAPELYTDEKLRDKRSYFINRGKPYVYNLIYRQKRDSREPKTFDLQYLSLYDYSKPCRTLEKCATTMIDTTRKSGNDFFSMPIFYYNNKTQKYRLTDAIFEQKSLGIVDDPKNQFAQKICDKIIKDKIIECCIENNTSNTTSALLKLLLRQKGYISCKFRDRYTKKTGASSNKIVRILNMEETIKNYIEFPDPDTLPNGSPLILFMKYLTNWSSTEGQKKTNPDDAPDSLAMYADEFIFKRKTKGQILRVGNLWQ